MSSSIKIGDVENTLKVNGLVLLSDKYVNLNTPLEVQCDKGHIFHETWKKLRETPICPYCAEAANASRETHILKKKGYRVLAIDQATVNSGWALYETGKLIGHGVIHIAEKYDTIERISQVNQEVKRRITEYNPDIVLLEDIQLQEGNSKMGVVGITTFKVLAQLLGVLCTTLHDLKIETVVVPPATWRAHVGVKGRTRTDKKKSGQLLVKQKYGITIVNDEADAILIGQYGADKYGKKVELIEW